MNDQKILEALAMIPDAREVQLADKIDAAVDDVRACLHGLVAVGEVVMSEGRAPNNLPCTVYNLSDKFKNSHAYKNMATKAAAAGFSAPGANRVERAIAFVRKNGTATSAELHVVMGLDAVEYPSSVLSGAVRTKRLVKDGKNWTLGPGPDGSAAPAPRMEEKPAEPVKETPAAPKADPFAALHVQAEPRAMGTQEAAASKGVRAIVEAEQGAKPQPVRATIPFPTPAPAAPVHVPRSHEPVYRCGLWSDGVLELQRDGVTVAKTTRREHEMMADFLGRMLGKAEQVAA